MKTKTIILILFLTQSFLCFGQEKTLKESVDEFVKEFKIKPSASKIEKGKNPFAGKKIEKIEQWDVNWIYFVNEKYYINSNFNSNTDIRPNNLGTYKLVKNGNLQIAVLMNKNKEIEAFVSYKNENEFWVKKESRSENEIYKNIKTNTTEKEFNIGDHEVYDINYNNPEVTLYTKNGKLGIKYQGKKYCRPNAILWIFMEKWLEFTP